MSRVGPETPGWVTLDEKAGEEGGNEASARKHSKKLTGNTENTTYTHSPRLLLLGALGEKKGFKDMSGAVSVKVKARACVCVFQL